MSHELVGHTGSKIICSGVKEPLGCNASWAHVVVQKFISIHACIHHSLTRSPILPSIFLFIHPPFTHPSIYPFIHSPKHPPFHPFNKKIFYSAPTKCKVLEVQVGAQKRSYFPGGRSNKPTITMQCEESLMGKLVTCEDTEKSGG